MFSEVLISQFEFYDVGQTLEVRILVPFSNSSFVTW